MAAVRHLAFVNMCLDHLPRILGGLYHCAEFGWNRCSSYENLPLLIFCECGLKMPINVRWGLYPCTAKETSHGGVSMLDLEDNTAVVSHVQF